MKDLSRHIEFLLCEHNSVALPGIGVFVTEDLQARYCEEESLYLPPVRSVSLDTSNTADDGKLETCLVQLHHVTRNVARKWISDYLDDISQSLMDMGTMDMGTMGRLVTTETGISFEVCEAGVNTPELYGLDTFHMAKLPAYAHKHKVHKDPTHFTIRLRRSTVHRVMTAAAMIIVALTIVLPNFNSFTLKDGQHIQMASSESLKTFFTAIAPMPTIEAEQTDKAEPLMVPEQVVTSDESATMDVQVVKECSQETPVASEQAAAEPVTNVLVVSEQEVATNPIASEPVVKAVEEKVIEESAQNEDADLSVRSLEVKGYCVVMASAITNRGADILIEKLNKEGFANAVKYNDNGMLRVVLTGYAGEKEARSEMAVVRTVDKMYSGSWLKHF